MPAEKSTVNAVPQEQMSKPAQSIAGLILGDAAQQRMFSTLLEGLELRVELLDAATAIHKDLSRYELMVADEAVARKLRPVLNELQAQQEQIRPALVATGGKELQQQAETGDFDAILILPGSPSDIAARLSVVLYAHRALAHRYQPALEELKLNRNIFRSVTNGISVANALLPDMPLLYVNPSFEVMTGYTFEEVEGKNCRFLQGDERDQPGIVLIREAIQQQRQTVAVLRNFRKDGSAFWNELTLSPIHDRDGQLTHFVGIQMDVTERVELETALRESEKLAAVGRLASSISHEINNPLEAVTNLIYLAQQTATDTPENAESVGFLQQADEELKSIKLITAQSLRFYKQSTRPEPVLCSVLVSSVLDVYRSRALNYGVKVLLRERSTQHIVAMASELRQVLSNLVANAIDAMKGGGGRLLVRTREATNWPHEKTGVVITVADTGYGMSEETQSKLFDAFYTTKGIGGNGLGLWISRGIVLRHRGRLRVRSCDTPGRSYTVFTLFLPFQGAAGEAGSEYMSAPPEA